MDLESQCESQFSGAVRQRGHAYFIDSRVSILSHDDNQAIARVGGSYDDYTALIDWSKLDEQGHVTFSCTCMHFDRGQLCKHLWALVLTLDEQEQSPAQDQADRTLRALWRNALRQSTHEARPKARSLHQRRIWYVLDTETNDGDHTLTVALYQTMRRKDGTYGSPTSFKIGGDEIETLDDPLDRQLLNLLLGQHGGDRYHMGIDSWQRFSKLFVGASILDTVLPLLAASGRFVLLEDEQPDPLGLSDDSWSLKTDLIDGGPSRPYTLEGRLISGDSEISLQGVLVLTPTLALFERQLLRIGAEHSELLRVLARNPVLEIPRDDLPDLVDTLLAFPSFPQIGWPGDAPLDQVVGTVQGRLSISAPNTGGRALRGDVSFLYGDAECAAGDPRLGWFDDARQHILLRDRQAEQALLDSLLQRDEVGIAAHLMGDISVTSRELGSLASALVADGWDVQNQGVHLRAHSGFEATVSSGIDWFDLHGVMDFNGFKAQLPELLRAVRNDQSHVLLEDGSHGMLPPEWSGKLAEFLRMATTEDGAIRFSQSQALLLDLLLAEQKQVTVDAGFDSARRRLQSFEGIQPRSPDRAFNGTLRDYQREGLSWLHFLDEFAFGGCLADDMGLGKTVQVLAFLQQRAKTTTAPSLVVVPTSLVSNWQQEAARFTPSLSVLNYTGPERKSLQDQLESADLVITTYGILRRDILFLKSVAFCYVILDEAQAIKNHNAQVAKASRLLESERRLALSGTPIENHLGELWSLFEFLNPGMLGRITDFQKVTRNSSQEPGEDNASLSILAAAVRPFILRRTKEAVLLELPDKTEQTLVCELSSTERKRYNELREHFRRQMSNTIAEKGFDQAKIHILEALLRLRQAACHPGLLDQDKRGDGSAKIDALLEQLESVIEEGHKALVFSQFTQLLGIVQQHLDKKGIVYEYLDGRTRKRQQAIDRFQNDAEVPLFLISLKAGGLGLNLTAADYVYILDPWWNPAVEAQAVDRAHRIGQTRPVFAYRLIAQNTVEEKIIELKEQKTALAEGIISGDNAVLRNLTRADLELLLS